MNYQLAQVNIADHLTDGQGGNIATTYTSFSPLITSLLRNSLTIASIILLALLLFGGLGFIIGAGSGDSKKAEQNKKTITSALVGFAIVFSAYFIIQIISYITGVQILNSSL